MSKIISSILVGLGQKLPPSWRVALTQLPAANWLRRISLLPFAHGLVTADLDGPLIGYQMRLDMRAGHRRFALGTYEPEVAALIQSMLKSGNTVLDIGANIGYFTLLMAHLVGSKGRVIAFEPYLPVYSLLQENLLLNNLTWVQAECLAVADVAGEARMQSDQTNPLSFVTHLSEKGDLVVSTTSVDKYLESRKLSGLDFIKIDVEGAEDAVIRGMSRTLGSLRPVVLVEIHANDGGESETLNRLKENGYHLRHLEQDGWTTCDTRARVGHVLAEIGYFEIHKWPEGL